MRPTAHLTFFLLLISALTQLALAQSSQPGSSAAAASGTAKVTSTAVWAVTPAFLSAAHKACDGGGDPANFAQCFISQMSKNGAPPEAVAFTQQLYKESQGDVGVLSGFHPGGPVDIAWIVYPLRANTNNGLLFVNGKPPIVNAEDLKLLDQEGMKQSGQWDDLKAQFPQVAVWPGDRDGTTWPNSQSNGNGQGSVSFILGYPLINGCHACARAGNALFMWNFDANGKFTGTTFLGMTPPPLPGSNTPPTPEPPGPPAPPPPQ